MLSVRVEGTGRTSSDGWILAWVASSPVPELPHGVVTFLFTDVEGGTRLWQDAPDVMAQALRLHDGVIEEAARSNNGVHIGARGEVSAPGLRRLDRIGRA